MSNIAGAIKSLFFGVFFFFSSHHKPRPVIRNPFQLSLFYCHPVADLCHCSAKGRLLRRSVSSLSSVGSAGGSKPREKGPASGSKPG